mmetsp:Transcript_13440/g.29190  ORF Transcript_13440/g.29190 Transcript_13440/m.29190 type:complete len:251 (+) Transcript_13440:652-1404(+)
MIHVGGLGPRPTLQIIRHTSEVLSKLTKLVRKLMEAKSKSEENVGDPMFEDGLDKIMTSLEIIDGLHEHVGRTSEWEGFLKLCIVGHAEECSTLVVEVPWVVLLRYLLGLGGRASRDIGIEPDREIAGTLSLGVKYHLVGTYEHVGVHELASTVDFRGDLRDDAVDGNSWLLGQVQETKVACLQNHAWLAIHAVDRSIGEIEMSIIHGTHLQHDTELLGLTQHDLGRTVLADNVRITRWPTSSAPFTRRR